MVVQNEPKILAEIFLCIPLIAAGVIFHLSAVQWVLLSAVTLFFLLACIFRTAAMLQAKKDKSLTAFHVNRIKCMGNALVTISAGISVITCLLIFVPLINQVI